MAIPWTDPRCPNVRQVDEILMPKTTSNDEIDVAILELAAAADDRAWRILMRRVYRRVNVILGGDCPDVDDVTQSACLSISKALCDRTLPRRLGERAGAWVTKIATNKAFDHQRASRRRAVMYSPEQEVADEFADAQSSSAVDSEQRLSLEEALYTLSEDQRAVVVLLNVDGLTHSEIATELGIPENTVKSRALRGRDKLRAYLEDAEDVETLLERSGL
jgi:RNA polymerase sigma-70 factor, ECF subfamily